MPLRVTASKESMKVAAAAFAKRWEGADRENADAHSYWDEFFAIFGVDRKLVGEYEVHAQRVSTGNAGRIDLLIPQKMAVEHKSAGKSLDDAIDQLLDYLPSLPAGLGGLRLLVACDFQRFKWFDTVKHVQGEFDLADLTDNLHVFSWLAGFDTVIEAYDSEVELNFAATELMRDLHDELAQAGFCDHDRRVWLTRILFCVFADDTEVWDRGAFVSYVAQSSEDGRDLGGMLAQLFSALRSGHQTDLDGSFSTFEYINGDLFAEPLSPPFCTASIREALLEVCRFDWSTISPAIFGSLFQEVMTAAERRELGAHYTSERDIRRTIDPLFLDGLKAELEAATSRPKLQALHDKLAGLTFFDPACGCGNFLVVTYLELRRIETEILRRLQLAGRKGQRETAGQRAASLDLLCRVNVGQFYGIEIEEFPSQIARTALHLADHIANREISAEFGQSFSRFPIPSSPTILLDNALRADWNALLPAEDASFVFGNPPFSGHALAGQHETMQEDKEIAFAGVAGHDGRIGRLDYVAAWYAKAIPYLKSGHADAAFVSTNSITHGEQARTLGPMLLANNIEVTFAHRTFAWTSEARGKAHVHVVIVGFTPKDRAPRLRRLFSYDEGLNEDPVESRVRRLNCYLSPAPPVYPSKHRKPLVGGVPSAPRQGSKPWDGGGLIVEASAVEDVKRDKIAATYLREFRQGRDLLDGSTRWCLWLKDAAIADLRSSDVIRGRLRQVSAARSGSRTAAARKGAQTPALFLQNRQPTLRYLAMPEVSSERREYVPMEYLDPGVIAGNKLLTLEEAPLWLFGILQSSMWMSWIRTVGGRLKSDYSLAPDLAYSAFPWPLLDDKQRVRLAAASELVLEERNKFSGASLADLYDPLTMPSGLRRAHDKLDRAVDSLYGKHRHTGDASRLAVLLGRYVELTGGDLTLLDDIEVEVV